MNQAYWRKCGNCKKEINWGSTYQKCSISSCRKFAYCSVDCWSVHNSVMGHMNAHAVEESAPLNENIKSQRRRIVAQPRSQEETSKLDHKYETDILIVASKLKKYVKDRHDLNTSNNVLEKLSDIVRCIVDDAIFKTRQDGRKTLMDRDF